VRVPYSWLLEYCDPELAIDDLAALLALRSTEVERISHVGPSSSDGFVVGRVASVEPHPDADRLSVCEVETGDATRTIVCGASNVAAGQTVAVALPGATMPDGQTLKQAKLRGVVSDGMILSETELQIGDDGAGIVELLPAGSSAARPGPAGFERAARPGAAGLPPGTPLSEVLPIAEPVLELEVNSNRVDCFGVYGVAREVHAVTAAPLADPPWSEDVEATGEGSVSDLASVSVEVPELCPRFTARVLTDIEIGPSPLWLKARLTAAGQRPINNVVDVTNYVMLLTAQPLHAFDLDRVPGGELIVRSARDGETMTTLDGVERELDSEMVLVCDRDGPSGIAGIMGGQISEVSDTTTRVLLEVATWNGVNILRTSRKLGLRSDASNRFEKQLHPELAIRAQRIASRLLVEACGAKLVPETIDVVAEMPQPHRPRLRAGRTEELLGMSIAPDQAATYLERLGFGVERDGDDLVAEVPEHRHYDVSREVDLVEEVGRIHGYDENLPSTLPGSMGQAGRLSRDQALRRRAEDVVRDLGFDAVTTLSLTDPRMHQRLRIDDDEPRGKPIRVSNPLSVEHSALRTTLLGSLLDAARYSLAHGAERVALSESGRAYLADGAATAPGVLGGGFGGDRGAPAYEPHRIACIAVGALRAASWQAKSPRADFFALKGALEALAGGLGVELGVEPGSEPFLHPGRAGAVLVDDEPAGWVGELHPLVCRAWDLEQAAGFEVDLVPLVAASSHGFESYEDVISYPAVHQDVAVVVDEDVDAARVHAAVVEGGGVLLRSAEVFDVYRGDQVGEGRKSLALGLEFRAADRTLTDEEVAERRGAIAAALGEIGGTLRE